MRGFQRLLRWLLLSALLILIPPVTLLAVLATESGTTWTLMQARELVRPLGIEFEFRRSRGSLLRRLELFDLEFMVTDTRFKAARVALHWRPTALLGRRLHVRSLEIAAADLVPPPPTVAAAPPEIPELALPLVIQIDHLSVDGLTVRQPETELAVSRIAFGARLDRQGLALNDLHYAGGGIRLQGRLSMGVQVPHALDGELSVSVDRALTGDDIGAVEARAELRGTGLSPAFDVAVTAPKPLQLRGELKLAQKQPGFDLSARWPGLGWPLRGVPVITLQAGQLTLAGVADDYRLALRTSLSGEGIPASDIDLVGRGDRNGLQLRPLKVGMLDGEIGAEGRVYWLDGLDWELALSAQGINPGIYLADWPGELGGRMDLAGSFAATGGELAINLRIGDLSGRLRDHPVSAAGSIDYRAGQLHAQALELASGPNRMTLNGYAGELLDLEFDLQAPDLAALYPGVSGSLEGAGQLRGTRRMPSVTARLSGQAVAYADMLAQDLALELDWREKGGTGRLSLSGVRTGDTRVALLNADLDGSPDAHRLNLTVEAEAGRIDLTAQGGLKQLVWQGELQALSLTQPALGEWLLQAPAALHLSADKARTSRLCLLQANALACTEGGWDAATGLSFSGSLGGLDLARLSPYLPGDAVIEGQLRGEFQISGTTANPEARFELVPGDGLIRVDEGEEPLEIDYRNARVSGRFANDRGDADLSLELSPNGRAGGRLSLGAAREGQRTLAGEIDADFPDLGLVAGFVPELQQVEGRLHMEMVLGGYLAAPRLTGALQILDARAQVPAAGITLTDVELTLSSEGEGPLRVRGQLVSGEGRVDISGTVDTAAVDGPAVDLTIQGESFQAAELPEASVQIAPDLRLLGSRPYHLSGKLRIPVAAIKLEEVPAGTVDVSADEIIVGEEATGARTSGVRNLTAGVRVELGDTVSFEGFGLETGLTGVLDTKVDARGPSIDGKIELRDGEYKAYGQDLTVERGRLLFAGPPGNPNVDLRAVRVSNDGDVKAYLVINGPLANPQPRIYTEPARSETEALAYLVTGNGLSSAGGEDGPNIAAAALAVGLSTADPVMQQLTSGLGLDEISVEAGEEGLEDSSVTLGKYLNPDLYVGYSQGLFNPEGAVLMRLRLRKKLTVESRSGNEQAVDLIYRIEHD